MTSPYKTAIDYLLTIVANSSQAKSDRMQAAKLILEHTAPETYIDVPNSPVKIRFVEGPVAHPETTVDTHREYSLASKELYDDGVGSVHPKVAAAIDEYNANELRAKLEAVEEFCNAAKT